MAAVQWFTDYFAGRKPAVTVPYGTTVTYGELAKQYCERYGVNKMSAQAIGGAVGRNSIAVLIPCHRVIGADGSLTGYAGGLNNKKLLLEWEGIL